MFIFSTVLYSIPQLLPEAISLHWMDQEKYRIKNSAFEGVPVWVSWVFLVPKVYLGV